MPWIVLKLAVGITIAIVAYTFYVYIGRLCVPMIRKDEGALGGRATGSTCRIRVPSRSRLRQRSASWLPSRLLRSGADDALGV